MLAVAHTQRVSQQTTGSLSALVIFAKFQGEAPGQNEKPTWADDIFDRQLEGSFAHFYETMSRGQLQVRGEVLPRRYSSRQPAAAYVADAPGTLGKFGQFNLEILQQADLDIDMGRFDNDGPDGVANSGDDDGYVDVAFINLLTVPNGFFVGGATGFGSLGLDADFISNDAAAAGGNVRMRSRFSGFGGTTQRGHTFSVTSSTMCHEFAHVLGLPDLFDQSAVFSGSELTPEEESAGIGKWGIMGLGTLGWGVEDGPNAFSAWSLAQLGWLGRDNEKLVTVTSTMRDVVLEQIDRGGRVLKIPITTDEYFLIENRQSTGSYYNRNVPGSGLLVWHQDDRADNDEELHKQVDLVCADGLFTDKGFPGLSPDPVNGGDNLDFWGRDAAYVADHNGNEGDATDPFDGVRFTRFAYDTNPGTRAHTGRTRNVALGIVLENIRSLGDGRMMLDVLVRQPQAGHITADTTWSGLVPVSGDIVVEPGVTLRIEAGTTVEFSRGDSRNSGFDATRSELLVYGELELGQGEAVTMRSAEASPRTGDWFGLLLMDDQGSEAVAAVESGDLAISHSILGLVRRRLPEGRTVWSGRRIIPWDVVVPAGAQLVVEKGSSVFFTTQDLSASGRSINLTELDVAGKLEVRGEAGSAATFDVASSDEADVWFGLLLRAGADVNAEYLSLEQTAIAMSGPVTAEGGLRFADGTVERSAGGVRLNIEDVATLERSTFTKIGTEAIRADGPGLLRLLNSDVSGNGLEGITLGNCSLEAIDTRFEDNGLIDSDNPAAGLRAEGGGEGQKIELWRCTVSRNPGHGLDFSEWGGDVELHGTELSLNRGNGLVAGGDGLLVFEDNRVERNLGDGAVVQGNGTSEIWTTSFADNLGTGLRLSDGASSIIEMSTFRNNTGLVLSQAGTVAIRTTTFENAPIGLESVDSSPSIAHSRFENNITAIRVRGAVLPEITANTFVNNPTAIDNQTGQSLVAVGNYWGSADSSAIGGLFKGAVDWTPFLDGEPMLTAVEEDEDEGVAPKHFALRSNQPNPFNAATIISFDLADNVEIVSLVIYDVLGQRVRSLVDGERLTAGRYDRVWDGRTDDGRMAATGVYLYRLMTAPYEASGRMLLLR